MAVICWHRACRFRDQYTFVGETLYSAAVLWARPRPSWLLRPSFPTENLAKCFQVAQKGCLRFNSTRTHTLRSIGSTVWSIDRQKSAVKRRPSIAHRPANRINPSLSDDQVRRLALSEGRSIHCSLLIIEKRVACLARSPVNFLIVSNEIASNVYSDLCYILVCNF